MVGVAEPVQQGLEPDRQWSAAGIVAMALSVCAAYYLGAEVGLYLRLTGSTPSVLWPPNAILTATLLLLPSRLWTVALAAALPAHLVITDGTEWSVAMVMYLFVTNCSEALIGAVGLRLLSDAPTRFDSLRRVLAFLIAVAFSAPFLSSFLDAGVVTSFTDEHYWQVWRNRLLSNVLTELTVVPAIVTTFTKAPEWVRRASPRGWLEASALMSSMLGVWYLILASIDARNAMVPAASRAPLAFLMPFVAWASIRFGPTGASLSIVTTTFVAVTAAANGLKPFADSPPEQATTWLRLLLTAVLTPLLVLAAVIEERKQATRALESRLRFEELLSQISQSFVRVPSHAMQSAFEEWLRRVGEHLALDCLMLFRRTDDGQSLETTAGWIRDGLGQLPQWDVRKEFPWATARTLAGVENTVSTVDDLPPQAERDRDAFTKRGFRSGVGLPLTIGDEVQGALAFMTLRERIDWPADLVARLRLVAQVFANAMVRKQSEDSLRSSESMKSAILASITSGVAVVNADGRVIAVNEHWHGLGCQSGLKCMCQREGDALLDACRAEAANETKAREVLAGLELVLAHQAPQFILQHTNARPEGTQWWVLSIRPLPHAEGGAVLTHAEITERKRAELEAQVARAELAHVSRLATMGELTASLAHELNQPLTGIVANAQAARRLLAQIKSPSGELKSILDDIVDDGRRAGAVIQRTRNMLRKGGPRVIAFDLNTLIREVAQLVASDAIIRNVSIVTALDPAPAIVHGDRIGVQQVVLNLLMNALEAIADGTLSRQVQVTTGRSDSKVVEVAVRDTGMGIVSNGDHVFDAFYTTKVSGMGMGLSIARSIVEAHGGTIRASNNEDRGATVEFTLPLAEARQ